MEAHPWQHYTGIPGAPDAPPARVVVALKRKDGSQFRGALQDDGRWREFEPLMDGTDRATDRYFSGDDLAWWAHVT